MSFSGFSTAYNEVFQLLCKEGGNISDNVNVTNRFHVVVCTYTYVQYIICKSTIVLTQVPFLEWPRFSVSISGIFILDKAEY